MATIAIVASSGTWLIWDASQSLYLFHSQFLFLKDVCRISCDTVRYRWISCALICPGFLALTSHILQRQLLLAIILLFLLYKLIPHHLSVVVKRELYRLYRLLSLELFGWLEDTSTWRGLSTVKVLLAPQTLGLFRFHREYLLLRKVIVFVGSLTT